MDKTPDKPLKEVSGLPDAELVKIALKGDKNGFQELVERYYKPIFGFIYLKTLDYHVTEDITQEVFLRGYRLLRKISKKPERFGNWIFRLAHNRYAEWVRERKRSSDYRKENLALDDKTSGQAKEENSKLEVKDLMERLKDLSESYYQVLAMKYQRGLNCEEIARELGLPVSTVTVYLTRAYKLLRKELEK